MANKIMITGRRNTRNPRPIRRPVVPPINNERIRTPASRPVRRNTTAWVNNKVNGVIRVLKSKNKAFWNEVTKKVKDLVKGDKTRTKPQIVEQITKEFNITPTTKNGSRGIERLKKKTIEPEAWTKGERLELLDRVDEYEKNDKMPYKDSLKNIKWKKIEGRMGKTNCEYQYYSLFELVMGSVEGDGVPKYVNVGKSHKIIHKRRKNDKIIDYTEDAERKLACDTLKFMNIRLEPEIDEAKDGVNVGKSHKIHHNQRKNDKIIDYTEDAERKLACDTMKFMNIRLEPEIDEAKDGVPKYVNVGKSHKIHHNQRKNDKIIDYTEDAERKLACDTMKFMNIRLEPEIDEAKEFDAESISPNEQRDQLTLDAIKNAERLYF